jgi:hypothetical protein
MSLNLLETNKMNSKELHALEGQLIQDGFDTILLTQIVGIEEKTSNDYLQLATVVLEEEQLI